MRLLKITGAALLSACMLLSSGCNSMTNTGKGALIGGGGGAAVGAGLGALIGGGKGAGIGSAIGAAVGAGAGALIGKKMDKQQQQLEASLPDATVEQTTDQNGLQAIKVTFEGGILFPTGKYTLNTQARQDLSQFAVSLKQNPLTDVQILGFTDNTGSYAVNEKLSNERASAVLTYLVNSGVSPTRLTAKGIPMADYVASNETAAGRAQNRRVEIYITASPQMVQEAENGTLN
ncbi:MAG TPA: OmpA family protein [Muribaculum sp.]|uniref:OmpA family protein n=1 Tax=Heminiphilus faecis TaxID=2601703 RepID=A0ABV4CV27_9BACT|nr:OmpA family protein [Heminiphilus faecis]RLT76253.1 OmpA family protein [bacterium J10(2018)]HRF68572.1 OmpA family protein [Muribaculum sp.]